MDREYTISSEALLKLIRDKKASVIIYEKGTDFSTATLEMEEG